MAAMVLRIALGALFVYAGYIKLRDPWALFAMAIDSYQILPVKYVELLAKTLPWFEVTLGLLLIAGIFRRTTTVITSLLLLGFFSLMVRADIKGLEINCGCFGPGEAVSWKTLLRDGSMLVAALFVTVMSFVDRRRRAPAGSVAETERAYIA